jgi:quercetin dioxygenase-like cupin family protein
LFKIKGKEQLATIGDVISIPKNIPHSFYNANRTDAHYIQEFFPALKLTVYLKHFLFWQERIS